MMSCLSLPWSDRVWQFVESPQRLAAVCHAFRHMLSTEVSDWELCVCSGSSSVWGAKRVRLGTPARGVLSVAPFVREMSIRCEHSPPCAALQCVYSQLHVLCLEGVTETESAVMAGWLTPLGALRSLEMRVEGTRRVGYLEWRSLPASLHVMKANVPLRMGDLPCGRLKRVEITAKMYVQEPPSEWRRRLQPAVWTRESHGAP